MPGADATDPVMVTETFLRAGASYTTYAPESLTVVTPAFWGDNANHQYILQMRKIAEAAILHVIPKDNWPTLSVVTSRESPLVAITEGHGVQRIYIPAHRDIAPLARTVPNSQAVEVGAIIMRASAEELDIMHRVFGLQED